MVYTSAIVKNHEFQIALVNDSEWTTISTKYDAVIKENNNEQPFAVLSHIQNKIKPLNKASRKTLKR